jgi:hypothetical protein
LRPFCRICVYLLFRIGRNNRQSSERLQIFSQSSSISRTSKTNLGICVLNMGPMELRKHPTSRESTKMGSQICIQELPRPTSSEVAQATCGGSLFQSPMVRGKNEYL